MKVSIITPFYKGNKYINRYLKNVANAVKNSKNEVEIILVNDSPNYEIEYNEDLLKNLDFKIVNNATNQGIQKSRINGLNKAKGEYIRFLRNGQSRQWFIINQGILLYLRECV